MADKEHWQGKLGAHPVQIRDNLQLQIFIQPGKWLVHENKPRTGEHGATQGHALPLSTGQQVYPALQQMF